MVYSYLYHFHKLFEECYVLDARAGLKTAVEIVTCQHGMGESLQLTDAFQPDASA